METLEAWSEKLRLISAIRTGKKALFMMSSSEKFCENSPLLEKNSSKNNICYSEAGKGQRYVP